MKILHLPTSTGGNAYGLCGAEKSIGLDSTTLYTAGNWLNYPGDIVLDKTGFFPFTFFSSVKAAFTIPPKYDVLHFNFGSSLIDFPGLNINHWDLPLYKKQRLVVTYNGCDARQRFSRIKQAEISACQHADCYNGICKSERLDQKKRHRIRQFKQAGATFFATNPDLLNFLPKESIFLPYTVANWDDIQPAPILTDKKKITVVHAPTNRVCKGSQAVIEAIESLKKKYTDRLELILVENVPHRQALEIYSKADIVIDQLRIGWYGALAVENMKMGKPVVVYINPDDLHFLPQALQKDCREAFIEANEYNLAQVLERYIENPALLLQKSQAALEYVHRWHLPRLVAQITRQVYQNEV